MFIVEPIKKADAKGELKLLYRMIEKSLGFIPPHFELFATIDLESMKKFVASNQYMMTHPKINKDLLPYLRLYIANIECRNYCVSFNTAMLEKMGAKKEFVENISDEIQNVDFAKEQKTLLLKVIKAVYKSNEFCQEDLEELYALGFSDKDFYDLLSYSTNFMSNSKMIEVYLK